MVVPIQMEIASPTLKIPALMFPISIRRILTGTELAMLVNLCRFLLRVH